MKQELDKQLPASIHRSKAYKRAESRGYASQRSYLKRYSLLNKDVQIAVQLLDNHIDTIEQSRQLVRKVAKPDLPVGLLFSLFLVLVAYFLIAF